MSQAHILEWLPAYHDGELPPGKAAQVEAHLQTCPSCRAEQKRLTELSALLRDDSLPAFSAPEHFAAQVQLLLPRRAPVRSAPQQQLSRWWLVAPLMLIVAWAFLQAALWVTSLVLTGSSFFPGLTPWLGMSSNLEIIGTFSLINLALLIGATILWGGWVALWWAAKNNQNQQPLFN